MRIFELEETLKVEREEFGRAHTTFKETESRLVFVTRQNGDLEVALVAKNEALRSRDEELARLANELEEERRCHADTIRDMRAKQSDFVSQLQDQIDALTKTNLRVEAERATLEAVLETRKKEDTPYGSLPRPPRLKRGGSSSSIQLEALRQQVAQVDAAASVQATSPYRRGSLADPMARRVEQLEKEAKLAAQERATAERETESLRRELMETSEALGTAERSLKVARAEVLDLDEEFRKSERSRSELDVELRRLRSELTNASAYAATQRSDVQLDMDRERFSISFLFTLPSEQTESGA